MSYKTIAVHADASRHAPARIRSAAVLARTHGAHLIGVAATGVSREVFPHGYHAAAGSLEASYFDPLHEQAAHALEQFTRIAEGAGVSFEARLVCDLASDALARLGRFSDLVVVHQDDPGEALDDRLGRIPEYVVFTCARPVLVLPCAPAAPAAPVAQVTQAPGRQVLVAWNGSKEAAAALRAAIPLLQRAARVRVVSFRAPGDGDLSDVQQQADLSAFLARHGVRADIMAFDRTVDDGHAVLDLATQQSDDLIVMGCYGHSQFRELVLGGASSTVLRSATVPVLMAR